jgi:hypothetical protein
MDPPVGYLGTVCMYVCMKDVILISCMCRRGSIPEHVGSVDSVVLYLRASHFLGRLLWVQEGPHRVPRGHLQHPQTDSPATMVHYCFS